MKTEVLRVSARHLVRLYGLTEKIKMKHGEITAKIGEKLTKLFEGRPEIKGQPKIKVYYDHGPKIRPNVCQPTTYFGELSTATALAFVDIVIIKNGEVALLCEIEEEGGEPKKIIGDTCAALLAEKIRIKDTDYPLKKFDFLLAMKLKEEGSGATKLDSLKKQIQKLVQPERTRGKTIQFISVPTYKDLLTTLEHQITRRITE